jgi:hypothetical protein
MLYKQEKNSFPSYTYMNMYYCEHMAAVPAGDWRWNLNRLYCLRSTLQPSRAEGKSSNNRYAVALKENCHDGAVGAFALVP